MTTATAPSPRIVARAAEARHREEIRRARVMVLEGLHAGDDFDPHARRHAGPSLSVAEALRVLPEPQRRSLEAMLLGTIQTRPGGRIVRAT